MILDIGCGGCTYSGFYAARYDHSGFDVCFWLAFSLFASKSNYSESVNVLNHHELLSPIVIDTICLCRRVAILNSQKPVGPPAFNCGMV